MLSSNETGKTVQEKQTGPITTTTTPDAVKWIEQINTYMRTRVPNCRGDAIIIRGD
jgi:hypothetical protein